MFPDSDLFKTLLDNLHEGVYFTDTNRVIKYWNKAAETISGFSADEVIGKRCADNILVHVDAEGNSLCKGMCPLAACMNDGERRSARVFARHKDGHRYPVGVVVAPIRNEEGEVIGGLETFYDASSEIAALAETEELRRRSLLCPSTGIANRAYCDQFLALALAQAQESPLGLALADVDGFKAINDTYGHAVGDIVLKMVARTLAGAMRSQDFIGRWGGEEFMIVLPGVKEIDLERMCERLRALTATASRQVSKGRLHVTISMGATLSRPEDTLASILARADKALRQSKQEGRNRITLA